ncbi:MAG: PDDEXK nuclease domain-containing protein [Bacteroidia bacterium]
MKFDLLVNTIQQTHEGFQMQAAKAINLSLTLRNWLIGFYIVEFEQQGEDRAKYGEFLLQNLAEKLNQSSLSFRNLKLFRQFFQEYPQIRQTLPAQLQKLGFETAIQIGQTLSAQLPLPNAEGNKISKAATDPSLTIPPDRLLSRLSFSHFVELMTVKENLKRTFYELECMKGNWGIRELKRQINSLYFERSGMSKNPEKLSELANEKAEKLTASSIIKSVYAFEFLGLKTKDAVEESDLETALLDHLQEFMLELGHGFCLEARQKKILIGDEYFFIDLVFYHRILKCHVLIDLKVEDFNHHNIGQLNTYLNYYKAEVMQADDNLPVGILLVTNKNKALVEYATAGMDNQLFVSKYLLELPGKEQLAAFIQQEIAKWK